MSDVENVHPCQRLTTPAGESVDVDNGIAPLVVTLWALGLQTAGSCQNLGESIAVGPDWSKGEGRLRRAAFYAGQAWLKMPADDGASMLSVLSELPKYRERFNRWTLPGAWESYVYLLASDDGVAPSRWAQIHFPAEQIGEVTEILSREDSRRRQR
jgi:hypothetical protein